MNIVVSDEIGKFAMSPAEGRKLLPLLEEAVRLNRRVHVDFSGVKCANSPFFKAAFYPLFEKYNPIAIDSNLVIIRLSSNLQKVLDQVKLEAEEFYKDAVAR